MAFMGRQNDRDVKREEAWREWTQRQHPLAIASFVLGVISLIEFGVLVVFGVAGVVLGVMALAKLRRKESTRPDGHRLAWTGIALSFLSLVIAGILYSLPPAS
jgi:hypothetical protein